MDRQAGKGKEVARLEEIIFDALMGGVPSQSLDVEVLTQATEYILDEIQDLDLKLGDDEKSKKEILSTGSLSIDSIENLPLHGIVQQACREMLGIEDKAAVMITSEILDNFHAPDNLEEAEIDEGNTRQRRGNLGNCEMCERCMMLTEHHLIPRSTHSAMLQRGLFTKKEMQSRLAMLCRPCHSFVHHIPLLDLAQKYNTIDLLLERPEIYKWAKYASKLKERDPTWGVTRTLKNKR
ncbi:hypothetical protein CBS101457_003359 [Exobasidium rhododendri]|nr:hypothetical protein CBS101457_003359 [Exobasidium rhododendri]